MLSSHCVVKKRNKITTYKVEFKHKSYSVHEGNIIKDFDIFTPCCIKDFDIFTPCCFILIMPQN